MAIARALLADPKILLLDEGKALRLLACMLACMLVRLLSRAVCVRTLRHTWMIAL